VALFNRKQTEDEKLLATARADLAAAQRKRATLAAREDTAAASADKYALWCTERDATDADIARLTVLVSAREKAMQEAAQAAAEAAQCDAIEACRAVNTAIKERRAEVEKMVTGLITFARDAAAAAIEANRLNQALPAGVAPIVIGDLAMRDLPVLPREELASAEIELWVNPAGDVIGDQDNVAEHEDGTGTLQISRSTKIICRKRKFRRTSFYPAFTPNAAGYFFQQLRLPFADRPGLAFDGSAMPLQYVAAINVGPLPPPNETSRPIRTELVPLEPWPPAGVVTEADQNAA